MKYRAALQAKGITPCIPPRKGRILPAGFDETLDRQRHKIANVFGRLKDWKRIDIRYDQCARIFMFAIAIAGAAIFWYI